MAATLPDTGLNTVREGPPAGFVNLRDVDPSIVVNLRYAGTDNFVGRPAPGYLSSTSAWMTREAAVALSRAQDVLRSDGFSLVLYDAFRPTRAVAFWCAWADAPGDDAMRASYFPRLSSKTLLFERGYVARRSGHSRGSTVDVSVIRVGDVLRPGPYPPIFRALRTPEGSEVTGLPEAAVPSSSSARPGAPTVPLSDTDVVPFLDDGSVDMWTSFDLLDVASHHDCPLIPPEHLARRNALRAVMEACGWQGTPREWWHWTLKGEPFPDTYFDFDIC